MQTTLEISAVGTSPSSESEEANEIGPSDDADETTLFQHRKSANALLDDQVSDRLSRCLLGDSDHIPRHDFASRVATLCQEIELRDDAEDAACVVNHRNSSDPVRHEQPCHFLDGGIRPHRHHILRHDLSRQDSVDRITCHELPSPPSVDRDNRIVECHSCWRELPQDGCLGSGIASKTSGAR